MATGIERATQTDSSGNYQIAALPVGNYRLEVQAQGFRTAVVNELALEVSQTVVQTTVNTPVVMYPMASVALPEGSRK